MRALYTYVPMWARTHTYVGKYMHGYIIAYAHSKCHMCIQLHTPIQTDEQRRMLTRKYKDPHTDRRVQTAGTRIVYMCT